MTTNSPNPVDGDVQALIMSQKEMQDFANIYRSDNDQGTFAWFDACLTTWVEGFLSPKVFEYIFDQDSATRWLDREIEILLDDGRSAEDYIELKNNPALNPVIVVFYEGKAVIWDGYHRVAAAVHRDKPVYAIFTTPPAQLLRPVELPEFVYDPEGEPFLHRDEVVELLSSLGHEVK
ncbi:hypothetical protein QE443_002662 [Pantoea ananatis]|uniref:hypothetical protein n=1 Tax=Pantoea ananas TaxID=553 RepID=UPI002782F829|nr:hypothetical protein [Pantoea ananatis]MDQ1226501.1 hypothetical protein [Pantoea ananatis]MDR6088379.1 hypothetical protein [Pantoea ananatis]